MHSTCSLKNYFPGKLLLHSCKHLPTCFSLMEAHWTCYMFKMEAWVQMCAGLDSVQGSDICRQLRHFIGQ